MTEKTCLITGASRGIGLATALRMAHAGYDIAATARGEDDLLNAAEEIKAAGVRCETIVADVSEPTDAQRIVTETKERLGRIDVLVNNAGVAPLMPLMDMDAETFDRTFAVNNAAVFHLTQAVWPIMKEQGGGTIVNISSKASVDPFPGFAVYGASKAWVNLFTKAVADEGKPHGIRVFAVAPGAVETQLLRSAFPNLPAKHVLEPDAVAAAVEGVCDDRLAYCTGQTVFVKK